MEGMIRGKFADIDGSIQKVQASLVEIHENIGMLVADEKERLNIKLNIKQVLCMLLSISMMRKLVAGCLQNKRRTKFGSVSASYG
uniref:Uncharacterized protein n=1 Tax=Ditylenchus dipsaci TaxID=166011 RepID=A0A915DKI9_9BILA